MIKMTYFFAGIKGSGMSALACMLHDLGNTVIGCDDSKSYSFTEEGLKERNISIYYNADELTEEMVFIYTAALKATHYAVLKAKELNCKMFEYFEMIGEFTKKYDSICIAGTHGKTTTTALLANILKNTIGANYLIGDGTGYICKDSNLFAVEACEYKEHFLNYDPKYSVITNIDLDHVDYYRNIEHVISAFQKLTEKTQKQVIACGDDKNVRKLKSDKIIYYGIKEDNDIIAKNIIKTRNGISFDVYIFNKLFSHFDLKIFGEHMILNALACIYICYLEGLKPNKIIDNINNFGGAKRRFSETIINDTVIVDDYAHHPNEIKTILDTVRQKYPEKKLISVFFPHTFSRTGTFYKEIARVLSQSDKVYIADIFPAREKQQDYPNVSSKMILDLLPTAEKINEKNHEELLKYKGEVIAFMSPKDIPYLSDIKDKLK
jgi:UDP-N-acetylmuramate--alanine ligase